MSENTETQSTKSKKSKSNIAVASTQSASSLADKMRFVKNMQIKSDIPNFRVGDTVKVHAKIVEGTKERIQIFEGIVIKRHSKIGHSASFTVRKVSYNIGVERTFMIHSPRIDKIEVMTKGVVRRARLFYLRPLRGKSARVKASSYGAPATS